MEKFYVVAFVFQQYIKYLGLWLSAINCSHSYKPTEIQLSNRVGAIQ